MRGKRSLKNFLLDARLQLPAAVYSTIAAFWFVSFCGVVVYLNSYDAMSLVIDMTDISTEVETLLWDTINESIGYMAASAVIFIMVNLMIATVVTHKMVGPVVQFCKHVENLRNGEYDSRVVLRKKDGFEDLAAELNKLAETLEEPSSTKSEA